MPIPESTLHGLRAYADHRQPPGGFLCAVLANDLTEAIGRADERNLAAIKEIVAYVYYEIPARCHGSREIVAAWLTGVPVSTETEDHGDER